MNQTTSVLIFNNKAVVVTASQYTAYMEKELYETQNIFFLFKIKCLDKDLKLISVACPTQEIILIVQALALFFFLIIWITRCFMTTIMIFKEMHLMTRTD